MASFHASRPLGLSGRPCYCAPDGRPIAALPTLDVEPETDGGWYVSCFLLVGHVTARRFGVSAPDDVALVKLLCEFREDVELFLIRRLGWTPPSRVVVPLRSQGPTLEELGL